MGKIVLTFGLIAGAFLALMMNIQMPLHDQIGFEYGELIGYTTMVLAGLMTYFGVRSYRDNVAKGRVGFGRAFVVGLLITLVSSACYVLSWEMIQAKYAPNIMQNYAAHSIDEARAGGATEQKLAEMRTEFDYYAKLYQNPIMRMGMTLMEPLPVGLLISLVSAFLVSRRKRDPSPAMGT